MQPQFMVQEGGMFDDENDYEFYEALNQIRREAFDIAEEEDLSALENLDDSISGYIKRTNALPRLRVMHGERLSVFPKIAFDMAENWTGDPQLPLDEDFIRKVLDEKPTPCHYAFEDTRLIDPKTVCTI